MKKIFAVFSLLLFSTQSPAQVDVRAEAHCDILRVSTSSQAMVSDRAEEKLSFSTLPDGRVRAHTYLESPLMPSYMIEFIMLSRGRVASMTVRTLRQSDGAVMSTFTSSRLIGNTRPFTADSRYTAEAKNIFLSANNRFLLDISCWENLSRD